MNNNLKVAIIGLGVGEHHLSAYSRNKNCKVVKVCDFDKKKELLFKKKYPNINFTNNYLDIVNDKEIKIVSIASYDNFHFNQIVKCIRANKHVFIEKPICLQPKQLKTIKRLLLNRRNIISSNMVLRTTPLFIEAKKEIEKKQFGNVFYLEADYLWGRVHKLYEWRSKINNYSLILGAAIHMIDLIVWILNMKPTHVTAYGNKIGVNNIKFDSFSIIILEFKNGNIAKVTANAPSVHPHFHSLSIFGSKKTLIHNFNSTTCLIKTKKSNKIKKMIDKYPAKQMRYKVINEFINHLNNKKNKLMINKKNIFDVMEICFSAQKSLKLKKRIKINY